MSGDKRTVGSRTIEVENPGKLLFPDDELSKDDLIEYYRRIADTMLPHVRDRPLTMQRFPDGVLEEGFYQKEIPEYFPEWIDRVTVELEESDERQDQVVCNEAATLIFLTDQGCITPHVWLSRRDRLQHPDKLVFDLDPPDDDFEPVRQAAFELRELLDKVDLVPYVMTTGSRGLHVVVPIDRSATFDAAREFARDLAEIVAERNPDQFTTRVRKDQREGRLFLDYLRNAYGQTSVAPYALRPLEGAPVATPLDWHELHDGDLHSQSYTIRNLFRRLGQKDDPWSGIMNRARALQDRRDRLDALKTDSG